MSFINTLKEVFSKFIQKPFEKKVEDEGEKFVLSLILLAQYIALLAAILMPFIAVCRYVYKRRKNNDIMPKSASFGGKKVIIIGSGMAGIKVAHTLAKKGIKFVMLEVSSSIGGRINHITFAGKTLETGAMWVQGIGEKGDKTNPIWQIAKSLKLEGSIDSTYKVLDATKNGKDITEDYDECMKELEAAEGRLAEYVEKELELKDDIDVKAALKKFGWASDGHQLKQLAEYSKYEDNAADNLENISIYHGFGTEQMDVNYVDFGEGDYLVSDQRGLSTILKGMVRELL